ncbi:uncharacterized protein G2W53_033575 [Senna tora]|uniref:Uncharacterized protein n=1 Tax=Senna tora TaxID=362788 RepID=A0A834WCY5_9FABA|nr:uncharacterized protein G2W53_033575 [Senna tora]
MAMRVRRFLYKNGSHFTRNDGLAFQADRVEGVNSLTEIFVNGRHDSCAVEAMHKR